MIWDIVVFPAFLILVLTPIVLGAIWLCCNFKHSARFRNVESLLIIISKCICVPNNVIPPISPASVNHLIQNNIWQDRVHFSKSMFPCFVCSGKGVWNGIICPNCQGELFPPKGHGL